MELNQHKHEPEKVPQLPPALIDTRWFWVQRQLNYWSVNVGRFELQIERFLPPKMRLVRWP